MVSISSSQVQAVALCLMHCLLCVLVVLAKLHEEVKTDSCHLIGFDLSSVSSLAEYWDLSPVPLTQQEMELQGKTPSPPGLLNQAETHLRDYAKLRYTIHCKIAILHT